MDELPPESEEAPQKKKLKRELRREALARMVDAARTERDFEAVLAMWDKLEQNEVRRLGNHEVSRGDIPLEYGAARDGAAFPRRPSSAARLAQSGDFLELLYSCPFEMHELIEDADVAEAVRNLKDDHKEILFYDVVCMYSAEKIGAIRGQSDRNIRKVRVTLFSKLRERLFKVLSERENRGVPMTILQRDFFLKYKKAALDGGSDQ